MALKLTVDEGNSSTKIALWDNDTMVDLAAYRCDWQEAVTKFLSNGVKADMAIFCSVRKHDIGEIQTFLSEMASKTMVLSPQIPFRCNIGIIYETPGTLGADRIAAAVGARTICPSKDILIVDYGTAVTYDVLLGDGNFHGGNIAPGIDMRLKALNAFTDKLPLVDSKGITPPFGTDTETAMRSGAVRGAVAETEYFRSLVPTLYSEMRSPIEMIITGGSAEIVAPYLISPFIYEPNLVMIGLNSILDYNAKVL